MLQLLFAVAFSAVPLTLYIPPIRSLNMFVEMVEDASTEFATYAARAYLTLHRAFSRWVALFLRRRA
ncbi:hypothetical protein RND81_14G034700 [Saponaria officinalis]|uniref:Uncharacterized protein n=1 Tax=Saponaria officinalis TaxID=3572 RepID=A0AAW1GKM5_SAPOF